MCEKLPSGDLNPSLFLPHPISTYTCGMTITSRVCGGHLLSNNPHSLLFYIIPLISCTFPLPPLLYYSYTHTHTHTHLNEKKRFSIISQIEHNMGMSHKNDDGLGAVWIHFFGYSISITHHSSFITHHSSLNFSHPFGIITQFPSLNIFHTICGPIPVTRCSFFFFFSVPKLTEANIKNINK